MSLKVAFFGTPQFSVPILDAISKEHKIATVVSQPDKPVGKGKKQASSAVSQYAKSNNLPLITPANLKSPDFKDYFLSLDADIAVVVAYGKILPQWLLDAPRYGAINIHASLLPQYRGASPIAASILNGDTVTGLTYIIMNSKMDEGDIIYKSIIAIDELDTTESLSLKLSQSASENINYILTKFTTGALDPIPQEHSLATYCQILTKADGQIDLYQPPQNLDRMIRAYHPWPGVWGLFKGKRVKLLPGGQVQMEGKKATSLSSFKHGYPDFPLNNF